MFVAFHTGYIDRVEYGSKEYFAFHPVLSVELIDALLEKGSIHHRRRLCRSL